MQTLPIISPCVFWYEKFLALGPLNLNLKMFSLYLLAYNILRVSVFELARILFTCCGFVFRLKLPLTFIFIKM